MTTVAASAQTIANIVSGDASDNRRSANTYINATERAGNGLAPRRLLSDAGFLLRRQFDDLPPNRRNYDYSDTDDPRDLQQILIVPYGATADIQRLKSNRAVDRNVHSPDPGTPGVAPYPQDPQFLMSGDLDSNGISDAKTVAVKRAAVSPQGPTPHFIINRNGDISVCLSVDATTHLLPPYLEGGVFIAIETAVVILRADHAQRRFDRLVELPPSSTQLTTLAVLIAKLLVACGTSFPKVFDATLSTTARGFSYQRSSPSDGLISGNFSATPPTLPGNQPNITYAPTAPTTFFSIVAAQGNFDLATDIWRPAGAPSPVAGRDLMRTMIETLDTVGQRSVVMGSYVSRAAGSRSVEMQSRARSSVFASRRRGAYRHGEDAAHEAAAIPANISSLVLTEAPTNYEPHTYDFVNGIWGDLGPY